jgi:hypothetical protein
MRYLCRVAAEDILALYKGHASYEKFLEALATAVICPSFAPECSWILTDDLLCRVMLSVLRKQKGSATRSETPAP